MLAKLIDTINHLKASGATHAQIADFVRAAVNSPLLAAAVAATPSPVDDLVLAGLKILFPPATA